MRRPPGPLLVALGLVLAAGLAACGGSTKAVPSSASGSAGGTTIVIKNFQFHPASLTVKPGATVTVKNEDSATHTVTAVAPRAGAFDTGDVAPGATKTFMAPSSPGRYPYVCHIHQFMRGTLTVS